MTEKFFDPIQRMEQLANLRMQLEKLRAQIAVIEAVNSDLGVSVPDPRYRAALGEIEAKIIALEMKHGPVH